MKGALVLVMATALVLYTTQAASYTPAERPVRKCAITRTFRMLTADCVGLNLDAIPQDLQTDIEILVMSYNRLRKLPAHSFNVYPSLKMLYLEDNLISEIEDDTFAALTELEVLNISLNGLSEIPLELTTLPKMRKIYIDENKLDESTFDKLRDRFFTITFLSMSHCGLTKMPPLSSFPELTFLNVSGNFITEVTPAILAPACQLNELDVSRNPVITKTAACDCLDLDNYLTENRVKMTPSFSVNCTQKITPAEKYDCESVNSTVLTEAQEIFDSCISNKIMMLKTAATRKMWLTVGISLAVVLGIVLLILFIVLRRNKRKQVQKNNNLNKDNTEDEPDTSLLDRGFNISA